MGRQVSDIYFLQSSVLRAMYDQRAGVADALYFYLRSGCSGSFQLPVKHGGVNVETPIRNTLTGDGLFSGMSDV